jgi:hypothetical protein
MIVACASEGLLVFVAVMITFIWTYLILGGHDGK